MGPLMYQPMQKCVPLSRHQPKRSGKMAQWTVDGHGALRRHRETADTEHPHGVCWPYTTRT
ncbi:hypothetical protein NQZ68_017499 [Dissostichus eleginoides]|nr:hypothetical protein NQZ68_017499 [Dissostichus eleginoides]